MQEIYAKINNVCLVIITAFVVTAALKYTKAAMIPFVFSIFLFSTLTPFVNWIQTKTKVPRLAAMTVALGMLIAISVLMILFVVLSVDKFISGAHQYTEVINRIISQVQDQAHTYGFEVDLQKIKEMVKKMPLLGYAQSLTGQIMAIVGKIVLVFIFTLFLLAGEKSAQPNNNQLLNEILTKVSSYISFKFLVSMATGICVWIVLMIFQVEMAFIFALLTVFLNFIPTVGSILAVALPVPMLLLQYEFSWPFWVVVALTGSIQFTIGNVIEPIIMGESMDLHPITILISLIFWGLVWGIAGMFLAVPITATLKIVFSRLPTTQSFSEILAGRIPSRQ